MRNNAICTKINTVQLYLHPVYSIHIQTHRAQTYICLQKYIFVHNICLNKLYTQVYITAYKNIHKTENSNWFWDIKENMRDNLIFNLSLQVLHFYKENMIILALLESLKIKIFVVTHSICYLPSLEEKKANP